MLETIPQSFQDLLASFILFLPKVVVSLMVFIATPLLAKLLTRMAQQAMERRQVAPEAILVVRKLVRWGIIILGVTVALQQVDFNVTAFLTGLGVLGFTVGFAIQDVSKNFVAGLLLLLQQPFKIGDGVSIGDYSGSVQAVSLRATEICTWDGKYVLIPNADVFSSAITNFSQASRRRLDLTLGVAYDTDLEAARRAALEAITSIEGVQSDPAPKLVFSAFGASSIDFTLYYWIDTTQVGFLDAKDAAVLRIKRAFEEAGIEIPYPIQTVYLQRL
jgi:small conductance mechanosensitive channel